MKKLTTLIIFSSLLTNVIFAQEEYGEYRERNEEYKTLFGNDAKIGGYGSFSVQYGPLAQDKNAVVFSARGAAIFGHGIAVGVIGKGYLTDFYYDENFKGDVNLAGGYGGIFIEPIVFPKFPVHISFPVTLGLGGITYCSRYDVDNDPDNNEWECYVEDSDLYFLVEPGAELELNLTRFFRLAFGVYYRYTTELDLMNTPADALNGFSGGVTFKFGKF